MMRFLNQPYSVYIINIIFLCKCKLVIENNEYELLLVITIPLKSQGYKYATIFSHKLCKIQINIKPWKMRV